ncbi:hypothetical protein RhiirA4_479119 [Rhizophagus irregularis]|uniref:Uncharacterized protein n=1 Tax=Rhizophagus irregularis TaxID=588596 RepID=A0A2I1HFX7_9GLOM|nr:hypothetical protein RhiirA4_479119 [Rhizophagus irregularis]
MTYLYQFTVPQLICEMYKIEEFCDMKLWKVNIDGDIEKISTDDYIVKLGGEEMKPNELFGVYFQDELGRRDFKANKIYDYTIARYPNKKLKLEEDKRILVRYDHCDTVFFEREELEENNIQKETKTLEPTISIDDLYNMGTLEVIVEKENDDESSSSGKDSNKVEIAFQTKYQALFWKLFALG